MPSGMGASIPLASFEIFKDSSLTTSLDVVHLGRMSLLSESAKYL